MKQLILKDILNACEQVSRLEGWGEISADSIELSLPKEEKFGDFATNAAMLIASKLKTNPRGVAQKLADELANNPLFKSVQVAGPGFINMTLQPGKWIDELGKIIDEKEKFGKVNLGRGAKVMVEFVSANPTGPLHIGHGRGAAVGDALANILEMAGYQVFKEYYINDVGLQMNNLGRSTLSRLKELLGLPFEEPEYKGDYIKEIAKAFLDEKGREVLDLPEDEAIKILRKFTEKAVISGIRNDLDDFRVKFDNWFSEESLHESGQVQSILEKLTNEGHIYENEGALWLKTESAGDEKDRVVRRTDGATTYLASDIAYHKNKFERGFETIVDVWGADHHGYIARMKAVVAALGADPDRLITRLVQIVNLKKGGKIVSMSTRAGVFATLREVMDEVGVDVTRYFFLMRSADSHLDFDIDLAKKHSDENPVFYIQYAHARCANVFLTAKEKGVERKSFENIDKSLLENRDELRLIRKLAQFPDVVAACAESFQPHPITLYLTETASRFHYFYKHNRVVTDNIPLTQARLILLESTMTVLKNGLELLGVTAPVRM